MDVFLPIKNDKKQSLKNNTHFFRLREEEDFVVLNLNTVKSLYRLVVRTLPFHGSNTGSNPVRDNST